MRKLILTGNIGADAEIRTNGTTNEEFATLSIGTAYKDKTNWTKINLSHSFKNIFPFLTKGTKVFIEGIPSTSAYINKEGKPVADLVCQVINIELMGKPSATEEKSASDE